MKKRYLYPIAFLLGASVWTQAETLVYEDFEFDIVGGEPFFLSTVDPNPSNGNNGAKVVDNLGTASNNVVSVVNPLNDSKAMWVYDEVEDDGTRVTVDLSDDGSNYNNLRFDVDFQRDRDGLEMNSTKGEDDPAIHIAIGRNGDTLNNSDFRPFEIRIYNNGNLKLKAPNDETQISMAQNSVNPLTVTGGYLTTGSNTLTFLLNSNDSESIDYNYDDIGSGTIPPNSIIMFLNGVSCSYDEVETTGAFPFFQTPDPVNAADVDFYAQNNDLGQVAFYQDTNSKGSIIFDNLSVQTIFDPSVPVVNDLSATLDSVVAGDYTTITADVSGTAPISYQWYIGESGDTSNPIVDANSAVLETPAINSATSFWVRLSNSEGEVDSDTITIETHTPQVYTVSNETDFNTALANARSGDTIEIQDGNYSDWAMVVSGTGSEMYPIQVSAETIGGVVFGGSSTLKIGGQYMTVRGLTFTGDYTGTDDSVIEFRAGGVNAQHCRLTDTSIIDYNTSTIDKIVWVDLYGMNNRIDHCLFEGLNSKGLVIVARLDENPDYHLIDHNYFKDRAYGGGENEWETIRLGDSSTSIYDAYITVEYNLFEHCDGEVEIISNKSCSNTYRYNTFYECAGALSLRHGDHCIVDSNIFMGNDYVSNGGAGGVRIMGEGHVVINNYFEGITDRHDGVITIEAGVPDGPLNGYFAANEAVVGYNTIVDSGDNYINVGRDYNEPYDSYVRSVLPTDLFIVNNAFDAKNSSYTFIIGTDDPSNTIEGNIGSNAPAGFDGVTIVDDLGLVLDESTGMYRPSSSSVLIDGSIGDYSDNFDYDIDGDYRSGIFDVGCDEYTTYPSRAPLTAAEVGPVLDNVENFAYKVINPILGPLSDLGNGIYESPWFGKFDANESPWVNHEFHGYLYIVGDHNHCFIWSEVSGWLYTSAGLYPYIYVYDDAGWIWYYNGTKNPRWFYNFGINEWENDSE